MKYKRFRWLFAAMSLALAGVVCLQVYWLQNAVELEKKKFTEEVKGAMRQASTKLETGEAITLISNALVPVPREDSLGMHHSQSIRITRKKDNRDCTLLTPALPPVPPLAPMEPLQLENDSQIIIDDSAHQLILMQKELRLKSAVKNVYMHYVTKSGSVKDRLSPVQIRSALRESFQNAGIKAPFEFAVRDTLTNKLELVSDSSRKVEFNSAKFRTALFPSDLDNSGEELLVLLGGGQERIVQQLWPQFLLSLLFTLFLISAFYLTFREALRQKKLGDIRSDFINNMTHEFKTPIATISLAADTVINEHVVHDAERVRHYAELIKRENRRMNEQVEKVLELALTERNELQMVKEPVELNELLARAMNVMALQVAAKKGKISSELTEEALLISGDAFHLERVFLNLLDNAIKYSKAAPEITVRSQVRAHFIVIEICDHGIGIANEEQKRIFEQFYRVSTGNLHDVKGFGLGLSYVKTIVERHIGKLEVESKPGKGSCFRITFTK